jgi:hypothetical protein
MVVKDRLEAQVLGFVKARSDRVQELDATPRRVVVSCGART